MTIGACTPAVELFISTSLFLKMVMSNDCYEQVVARYHRPLPVE